MIENVEPGAEGDDQGVGKEQDYNNNEYIGPESKPVIDEDKPAKKDTLRKSSKEETERPIGSPVEEPKKKKGIFQKLFGKKDKG
jgi:penicillin-binding protein 1A